MKMERLPGDLKWVYNLQNSLAKFSWLQRELTPKKASSKAAGSRDNWIIVEVDEKDPK